MSIRKKIAPAPLARAVRLALLGSLAAQGAAWAQDAQIERVEVTAQRRLEPLQDVPAAVNALTARQLEARGITSTQDFVDRIPNMSFDTSYTHLNSFVVLRGVTQINNADSPVAIIVDGVPQNSQKQFRMNLFDVERIEVLKGPQGALYGRNALGGAVNIVTRAPTDKFEGFAGVSLGNGSDRSINGGFSGALQPGVAFFRLVAQDRSSDGLIENTFLKQKVDGIDHDRLVRGKLNFVLGNDVTIDLRAGHNDFRAGAIRDGTPPRADAIVNPRTNIPGKSWGTVSDLSAKIDWQTAAGTLTSITAHTRLKELVRGDLDFSNATDLPGGFLGFGFQAGQGQDLNLRMTSQELRLTSPDKGSVRWIGGLYYLRTERELTTRAFIDVNSSRDQIDVPAQVILRLAESNRNTATALFGQVDMDLGSRDFTLSAALRYDRDARTQNDLVTNVKRDISFNAVQPKFTLTRKFSRDALVYGTYSTGFRSGGLNAPGLPDFKDEHLKNYEIGTKNTLLGGSMVLNAALFEARSRDFQYFFVDVVRAAQIIGNIDRVRMRGADIDLRWRVTRDFELDAGLGITDSIIKANTSLPDTVGKHTPKNSPLKFTFGAQHEWRLAGGSNLLARVDLEHRSKKYWHADNLDVQPGLSLLNARLAWNGVGDRWSVALWGKNLTDEKYYADVNAPRYSGLPYLLGWLAPPRTYGVDAKFRF